MNPTDHTKKAATKFLIEKGLLEEGFDRLVIKRGEEVIVLNDLLVEFYESLTNIANLN